jgi:hypothetical protein
LTPSSGSDIQMPTAAECRRMGQAACENQRVRAQQSTARRSAVAPNPASDPPNGNDTAPRAPQSGAPGTDARLPSAAECRSMGQAACEALRVRLQQETHRPGTATAAPPVLPSSVTQQVDPSERTAGQEVSPGAARLPATDQTPDRPGTGTPTPTVSSSPTLDDGSARHNPSLSTGSRTDAPPGSPAPSSATRDASPSVISDRGGRSRLAPQLLTAAAALGLSICIVLLIQRRRKSAEYELGSRPRRFGPPVLDASGDDQASPEPVVAILESQSGVAYPVQRAITHIGRSTENEIIISDPAVSRLHAIMRRQSSG